MDYFTQLAHNFGIVYSIALALWLLVYFGAEKIRRHKNCKKACGAQKTLFAHSAFQNHTFSSITPPFSSLLLNIQEIYDWDGNRISQTLAYLYIMQGCEYEIVQKEDVENIMSDTSDEPIYSNVRHTTVLRLKHPLIPTQHSSFAPIQQPINQGLCKLK